MTAFPGRHYQTGRMVDIAVQGGIITEVAPRGDAPVPEEEEFWLAPALVDLQVNGFGGHDLNDPQVTEEDVRDVTLSLQSAGVAYYCPTVTTGSHARMLCSLEAIALSCRRHPEVARAVLGIHMEGPFISPDDGPRGAHPRADVRPPDYAEFRELQAAAEGRIRIMTMAPELPGAIPFIERLVADGVVVGLGHLNASAEEIVAAVAAGATLSTHLGNGAHAMLPRHPNFLWEQLANDDLYAGVIPDGHHLPPSVVKTFLRAKGLARTILVSDAIFAAGLPQGKYRFMDHDVELTETGRVQLAGTPYLAGSALRLIDGLSNAMAFAGVSLADAVAMSTENPRRLLGLPSETGLREGDPADLLLLCRRGENGLSLVATVVAGEVAYSVDDDGLAWQIG